MIPAISLNECEYDKKRKVLNLASEYIGMPLEFDVVSHHTNKTVRFTAVRPGDALFDEDGWDGECCVYRPVSFIPNVEYMVIYNQW